MPTSDYIAGATKCPVSRSGERNKEEHAGYFGSTGLGGKRNGHWVQNWPDGSRYEGEFVNDLKEGRGVYTWANGEFYEGSFYKDYRHGVGTYNWPGGSRFNGKFYLNQREGYGTQHFPDGTTFQGLYHADQRFGPGVVTYADGLQDVGLWHRERLLKLCTVLPGGFVLRGFPEPAPSGALPPVQPPTPCDQRAEDPLTALYQEQLELYSTGSAHLPIPPRRRRELDQRFYGERDGDPGRERIATAALPLQLRMQAHIHRHRFEAETLDWDVAAVLSSARERFCPKGPREQNSEHLILEASRGDPQSVYRILRDGMVHPNVADAQGHTALIAAAVRCHDEVIHLLLDVGADVDQLNATGMSALAACCSLYFPLDSLLETTAERVPQHVPPRRQVEDCEVSAETVTESHFEQSIQEKETELTNQREQTKTTEWIHQNGETDATNQTDQTAGADLTDKEENDHVHQVKPHLISTPEPEVRSADIRVRSDSWDESSSWTAEREVSGAQTPDSGASITEDSTFDSTRSLAGLRIQVTEEAMQRAAEVLSRVAPVAELVANTTETVWKMAFRKAERRALWNTIELLLSRGADPNASSVPMPVLFLAIKARDIHAVRRLLECGARTDVPLRLQHKGLYPLHVAAGLPGAEGPMIVELLLHALADPDVTAQDADEVYELDKNVVEPKASASNKFSLASGPPSQFHALPGESPKEGGRTPLHVACQRDDDYSNARDVVSLLVSHKANTNLLWSGHSPLSLSIASGNGLAVDELLAGGADPNLPLTRRLGSALCATANVRYDCAQRAGSRIRLLEKLIKAGANILMPVLVGEGSRSTTGTAVDYAHFAFHQDGRVGHTPYHALTPKEREAYNARQQLLALMGDLLRQAAVRVERQRLAMEQGQGIPSISSVEKFMYTGAGATPPWSKSARPSTPEQEEEISTHKQRQESRVETETSIRKPLFKYCYQCGRSVGVALQACCRCHQVFYCNKMCKMKAWSERHREECIRVPGRAKNTDTRRVLNRHKTTGSEIKTGQKTQDKKAKEPQEQKGNYSFI